MKVRRIFSPWSKEVKKAMIDRDMEIGDVANHFHWSRQYASRIINGYDYHRDAVESISMYFNIPSPGEGETLARKKKIKDTCIT